MNAADSREEELFETAGALRDPGEREAFLDSACAGNGELRARLTSLLAARDEADQFFDEGASLVEESEAIAHLRKDTLAEEPIGTRIGRYKLTEKIGEGGCGVVYLAEQEEPVRRQVALKIIRLGMESRSVIARFEAERQAIAMMDHPHIARVFDAGATERGSPYFVMEHVRGVRITEFCDRHRLSVRQRLDLLIQTCHAIQHAHQKGIVHGDIKPSNILIAEHDGVLVPKIIDFGVSRVTDPRLAEQMPLAAFAQLIGTPAYMSPEQVEPGCRDVDTRSDIYSLGALAYVLLTGCTPFDGDRLVSGGLDELRRILREEVPPPPSEFLATLPASEQENIAAARRLRPARLIRCLKGDLDCIVGKALEKDRRRRYETANAMAMELQRHLNCEPVIAHPPGWCYSFAKLVRRNRGVFIASGAVAAALVMGLATSTWLFLMERDAHRRALAAEQQQMRLRQEAELREKITQAALMVSQERYAEADAILRELAPEESSMEGAAVYRAVGEWHAIHERWAEASDRFGVLLRINQLEGADVSSLDYLERGPVLVEMGDLKAYDAFRMAAVQRFGDASSPFADRIVKISLLTPASRSILAALEPLAEATRRACDLAESQGDSFQLGWRAMSMALYAYRRGEYEESLNWCRRSLESRDTNVPRICTVRLIHALALRRLGYLDEAQAALEQARAPIAARFLTPGDRGSPVNGFWFDWAFARILLREATAEIRA